MSLSKSRWDLTKNSVEICVLQMSWLSVREAKDGCKKKMLEFFYEHFDKKSSWHVS
jgi:hypothetical protein